MNLEKNPKIIYQNPICIIPFCSAFLTSSVLLEYPLSTKRIKKAELKQASRDVLKIAVLKV